MPDSDKPPFGVYEPPPPRVRVFAGIALALNLATVAALLLGRCDIATPLAVAARLQADAVICPVGQPVLQDPPGQPAPRSAR